MNKSIQETKKKQVLTLLDNIAESQDHYKLVLEAAEQAGIYSKYQSKA